MRLFIQQVSTLPNESGAGDQIIDRLTKEPLAIVHFKHRADGKIELRFLEESTAVSAGSIELSIKHSRDFNGTVLAYSNAFNLVGALATGYYTGYPSFDVSTLNLLFNAGTLPYIDFGMEITWLAGGHRSSTNQITARIWNNYVKAADSGITPPVGVTGLSVITGVLNGPGLGITSTALLAGYTTLAVAAGRIMIIPETNAEVGYTVWYLQAGTSAHDPGNGVVRPTDYATTTNEKIWVGIL